MIKKPSDFGGLCFSRVVVVGANGAGKTWLAARLADRTGAPMICKDTLALMTGWRQRPRAEVLTDLARDVAAKRWILEGGPSILSPEVLARATLVIWLDMPAPLRAWRVFRRSVWYFGRTRPEHPQGNRDWPGLRQVQFFWQSLVDGDRFRAAVLSGLEGVDLPVVRLRDRRQVRQMMRA